MREGNMPTVQTQAPRAAEKELQKLTTTVNQREKRTREEELAHAKRQATDLLRMKVLVRQLYGPKQWEKWADTNITEMSSSRRGQYMTYGKKLLVTRNLTPKEDWDLWQACSGNKKAPAHVSQHTGECRWHTPPEFVEAARLVLGGKIDLDPASSDKAQQVVQARKYFTREDDGLSQTWEGSVWLNPPYGTGQVERFVDKLLEHVQAGNAGILLTNNATETRWWQEAARLSRGICFPQGRVKFVNEDGQQPGAPLQGQAVLYFGDDLEKFLQHFGGFGFCTVPSHSQAPGKDSAD
jgi:ParB family chromosome partitioning protein